MYHGLVYADCQAIWLLRAADIPLNTFQHAVGDTTVANAVCPTLLKSETNTWGYRFTTQWSLWFYKQKKVKNVWSTGVTY